MDNNNTVRQMLIFYVCSAAVVFAGSVGLEDWPHYARTPNCVSVAVDGPNTLDVSTLQWIAWEDPAALGYDIEFEGAGNLVTFKGKVYTYAKFLDAADVYVNSQIICLDAITGQPLWYTVIERADQASSSSPTIDTAHNTVLIGSGETVYALDCDTGNIVWSTPLVRSVVNASVAIAADLSSARAFITDFDGTCRNGKLYCINLDPNDVNNNPYAPGEIVWEVTLGGTSGATPAYKDGVVYVACIKGTSGSNGIIYAYDAAAATPVQLWQTTDSRFSGFFGGVTVTKEGYLYAASYNFFEKENNSALCKINSADGSIVWVTQTERTNSIPVVAGDKIFISGGIAGFGSRPKISAYRDLGATVEKLWETPSDFIIGGRLNQPVYANGKLYVGSEEPGNWGVYNTLYILDVTKTPQDAGFVMDHYDGCGSSPVVTHDSIYSIGYDGLYKFYQPALIADIADNAAVDIADLYRMAEDWLWDGPVGVKRSDLTLDGLVNFRDFAILAAEWNRMID